MLRCDAIIKMVAEEAGWYICVVGIWVLKERLGRNAHFLRTYEGEKRTLEIANNRV